MLRIQNLTLSFGTRVLYSKVNLTADAAERIGLIGDNGSGKTTLFRAILGEVAPEDGSIEAPDLNRIAYVAQNIDVDDSSALDFVLAGHAPLQAAKTEVKAAEAANDAMRLAAAHAALAEANEGAVKAEALCIMAGLGFSSEDASKCVREFSGGWRNRLALARALMRPADLLLLDEPTNHLDIDSLIWLEAWLKKVESTVIIISHDREFLDRATRITWAVENQTIKRYSGNYSSYEEQSAEAARLQDANARAYERKASHLSAFIERFRYKATKARQAQSRIKMLEKLEVVEPVREKRSWRFTFPEPERCPEHLIDLEDAVLGYEDTVILRDVKLSVRAGERIGVLGVNGAGKSTLVKTIDGVLPLISGERRLGQGALVGYFAQHQLEQLEGDMTPLETLRHMAPNEREVDLRNFLGRFRFSGEAADSKIAPMSGGEKARLALAMLSWRKPNLLVLDEPTNHLDMATREALTMALSTFEGALLLVSHDRHLLRSTCDRLILVHDGRVTEYEGDLDDYANLVLEHRKATAAAAKPTPSVESTTINRREERRLEAQERSRIAALKKPLLTKLSTAEKKVTDLTEKLHTLDAKIADTAWYTTASQDEVSDTLKERGMVASDLEAAENLWLTITEEIEAIK